MPIINCAQCNDPFYAKPARIRAGARYCSMACRNASYAGRVKPDHWLPKVCPTCGKGFSVLKCHDRTHCSRECTYADPQRSSDCRTRALSQWKDDTLRDKMLRGIAQRSQSKEWRSAPHFQRGADHPRYKGNRTARATASRYEYKRWHRLVLQTADYTCHQCGKRGGTL